MRPTDILKDEHEVILSMLDALAVIADRSDAAGAIDTRDGLDAVAFFRRFADRLHHGKEEARLFPAMIEGGYPSDGGPVAVMLMEHDEGRQLVGAMEEATKSGQPAPFGLAARKFVSLLRAHIEKENHCLFAMAEGVLSPPKAAALLDEFATYDSTDESSLDRKDGIEIAERLTAKYGVTLRIAVAAAR